MSTYRFRKLLSCLILPLFLLVFSVKQGVYAKNEPVQVAANLPVPSPTQRETAARSSSNESPVGQLFWHEALASTAEYQRHAAALEGFTGSPDQNAQEIAEAFVRFARSSIDADAPNTAWHLDRSVEADKDAHIFLQQTYQDVPILGGQLAIHIQDQQVKAVNGEYLTRITVEPKATVSVEAAYKAAVVEHAAESFELIEHELVIYNPALFDLPNQTSYLAYKMTLRESLHGTQQTFIVDAHSGKVLLNYGFHTAKNREIYDFEGGYYYSTYCHNEEGPLTEEPSADCTNAFEFSGDTYDYFFNTFGRDSFDGNGATMFTLVNYGTEANAYWNGYETVYGTGYATQDVVAHEWSHAVTQYSADLIYYGQSGALNESFSDIFGAMVDREDWLMGEDTPSGAIRSLENPNDYGHPASVNDSLYYCGWEDNGGVHYNSSVPNHAAYLLSDGGTLNDISVEGIGRDATEQIFYHTLTNYLIPGSNFADAHDALLSSCSDLYGSDSATCQSVANALLATEMNEPVCGEINIGPDSYEPDDTLSHAQPIIVNGAAQDHNFHQYDDWDWVTFEAKAGLNYTAETFNLGENSDTVLFVYNSYGYLIGSNDDGGDGSASKLTWYASQSEPLYLMVYHYSPYGYGAGTEYSLEVTAQISMEGADSYELDNVPEHASSINTNGETQQHNFHFTGDADWISFHAQAGESYLIETSNLKAQSDTVLELYDQDGATNLVFDDDGGTGYGSMINWRAPNSGKYFVRVTHYSLGLYGEDTGYDLNISHLDTSSADSYEPDNNMSQASHILANGEIQQHNFHVAGDNDWFVFYANADEFYTIQTFDLNADTDTYLYLYAEDSDLPLAVDDDGGDGLGSRISYRVNQSGYYYIRARHYSSHSSGSHLTYKLQVLKPSIYLPMVTK